MRNFFIQLGEFSRNLPLKPYRPKLKISTLSFHFQMLEKCLRLLFEKRDVTTVKAYVQRQLAKIVSGKISLQELTFAREFRGLHGYRPGACVPALELTRRFCKTDRMRIPNVGERVPYVIVYGEPGRPLIQSVSIFSRIQIFFNRKKYVKQGEISDGSASIQMALRKQVGSDAGQWDLLRNKSHHSSIVKVPFLDRGRRYELVRSLLTKLYSNLI